MALLMWLVNNVVGIYFNVLNWQIFASSINRVTLHVFLVIVGLFLIWSVYSNFMTWWRKHDTLLVPAVFATIGGLVWYVTK